MAEDDMLNFTIQLLSGEQLSVQAPRNLRIFDLKILVEETLHIHPSNQRIIYAGQHLEPNRSLADYNIISGVRVYLVTNLSLYRNSVSAARPENTPLNRCTISIVRNPSRGVPAASSSSGTAAPNSHASQETSSSSSTSSSAAPASNELFNSLIHSMAHSAATSVASVVASNAVAQLGLSPGVISLSNIAGATALMSGASSSSTSTSNDTAGFPVPGFPPAGFATTGFHGSQRFGPFVMGEYNGIPVAIGGTLVGGSPMVPNVYVSGFSSAASNNTTSSNSTSDVTSSSQSSTVEVTSNVSATRTTYNQMEGTFPSSAAVTTTAEGASATSQRPMNADNRIGALISNIIQHLTPTVTSMTANAVSRYMPSMATEVNTANTVPITREETTVEPRAPTQNSTETMRQGLNGFINSISDVLATASQGIREANDRTSRLGNQIDSSSQRGALNTGLGGAGGNGRQRLYISNDYVNDRLPWGALNQLLDLLQEETGWRRPRMQLPPSPNALGGGTGPMSVFLSAYGQVINILQTLFLQVQAWQEGFAALDVPRFGRTVQALAFSSQINAQLSSVLAWIFQSMVEHVDPENLNSAMGWDSHVVENRVTTATDQVANTAAEESRSAGNVISVAFDSRTNKEMNENKNDKIANKNDKTEISDQEMKSAHETSVPEEVPGNAVHTPCPSTDVQHNTTSSNEMPENEMPEEVTRRFTNWTSDSVQFFKQLLRDARQVPFSSSYISGDATASRSLRDATQEAADRIFSLNWHRALNSMNINECHDAPQELNEMYMAQTMVELVDDARHNSDYQQQSDQYPGIMQALELIDQLCTVSIPSDREDGSESDDGVMVEFESDLKAK